MSALNLYCSTTNNAGHSFFQPNYKSIVMMQMNVKECHNFFSDQLATFVRLLSKIANFVLSIESAKF